jgi:hypothetical protein
MMESVSQEEANAHNTLEELSLTQISHSLPLQPIMHIELS